MVAGPDDTVRITSRRPHQPRRLPFWLAGAGLIASVSAGGAWWAFRPGPVGQPATVAVPAQSIAPGGPAALVPEAQQQAPPGKLASEAEILADEPEALALYRFAPQPSIVVLQFPTLTEQALMLNRVAALTEKAGFARDAVMPRDELDRRIVAGGGTPPTFYYGHDYSAAEIARFFALATGLDTQEQDLLGLAGRFGWQTPGAIGAVITLVRRSAALDAAARATILRHELSHGYYFTDPAYAAFCQRFWSDVLTADERLKFMTFLGSEGYDISLSDLVVNETQAYLVYTRDSRFFTAASVGLPQARIDELRRLFVTGMPAGWLRDHTAP